MVANTQARRFEMPRSTMTATTSRRWRARVIFLPVPPSPRYRWRTASGSRFHVGPGANAAKREIRVLARGVSSSQFTARMRLSAVAINRCCKRVFAAPR